tara:strand:- start:2842 stop:4620 length:1779 start_codon:yes stop_codon:yes gene_type:complete
MAIIYQISLNGDAFDARGKDWPTLQSESGCKPNLEWVDPILGRGLLKSEFGCSVSHFRVWEKIAASGVSGIILEEDAVFSSFDVSDVDTLLNSHDSVWLGYRENSLGYWYNAHAYAITPKTALELIKGFSNGVIPADEWLPLKLKGFSNYFYKPELVKQIPRSIRPSTIEVEKMLEGKKTDLRVITIATEPDKMWALEQSAKKYEVEIVNLGKDHPWRDEMSGMGGMPKIQLVNEYLSQCPPDSIILFMDGYDTFLADNPATIVERYLDMGADIVFAAESECWPLKENENLWPETGTKYRFLNSGLYIGKAKALHEFCTQSNDTASQGDDQLYCQSRYLNNNSGHSVMIDTEAYIFQCHEPNIKVVNGQLWNSETNCCGCIYHGNGGNDAKKFFIEVAQKFSLKIGSDVSSPYYLTLDYKEVAPEILVTDFLSKSQCDYLISKSESNGDWGQMEGDKFPAQEIRIKKIGLWHEYERLWHEKLGKIAEKHWHPMAHYGLRDAFTMRYGLDTQKELGLHTDASLVTGSVKLNEDYEGAELLFPRQKFSNINVGVGQCILFPGEVTHGHEVPPLLSGVKYSLTMWTSRYAGDLND